MSATVAGRPVRVTKPVVLDVAMVGGNAANMHAVVLLGERSAIILVRLNQNKRFDHFNYSFENSQ